MPEQKLTTPVDFIRAIQHQALEVAAGVCERTRWRKDIIFPHKSPEICKNSALNFAAAEIRKLKPKEPQ